MRKVSVIILLFLSHIIYGQRITEDIFNDTFNMFFEQFDQISETILNRSEARRTDGVRVIYYENNFESHTVNIDVNGVTIDVWSTFYTVELQPTIDIQKSIFEIVEKIKKKDFIETPIVNHPMFIYHPIYGTRVFSLRHKYNEIHIFCFMGIRSYTFCITRNNFSRYYE